MDQKDVITIDQEVEIMKTQMKKPPKLLNKFAGSSSCCIFRVPQSLVEINKEAYRPRVVSIGPYHHGNKDLEMIQEHKWRYLDDMITRTGKSLDFFMHIMVSMEDKVRESYSESIDRFATNDLAKMMVLDGVFLIEFFRKVGKLVYTHPNDPIFKMGWLAPLLMVDFLRIENQIPFFVLKKLFEKSKSIYHNYPLGSLIFDFFNYAVSRQPNVFKTGENIVDGKHLLDFFRKSLISLNTTSGNRNWISSDTVAKNNNLSLEFIGPATKLVLSGVKFEAKHYVSFLDIEFENGRLLIPQINMDHFYSSFFLNSMAFEQCYFYCSKQITTYVAFMGCLINTTKDVRLLLQKDIIVNSFGSDKDIAKFFKDVGKDMVFDIDDHYLAFLFMEVNKYCKNRWRVGWVGFKHTYFESPWSTISAFAAFMLVSLAIIQTFFTIFPYYRPKAKQ